MKTIAIINLARSLGNKKADMVDGYIFINDKWHVQLDFGYSLVNVVNKNTIKYVTCGTSHDETYKAIKKYCVAS